MCLPVCSSLLLMAYSMLSGNHAGARAQIVNAAFQTLEPWSTKSNLSTRIKTLYEKTDDFKAAMEEQLQAKREAFLQDVHASLQRGEWRPQHCASLCASCTFPAPVRSRRPRGDFLQVVHAMSLKREPISLPVRGQHEVVGLSGCTTANLRQLGGREGMLVGFRHTQAATAGHLYDCMAGTHVSSATLSRVQTVVLLSKAALHPCRSDTPAGRGCCGLLWRRLCRCRGQRVKAGHLEVVTSPGGSPRGVCRCC